MTALNTLGKVIRPDSMIAEYEAQDHFKTYLSESDASFSANCNILNALLHAPAGPDVYVTQIEKALRYLCSCWWRSNGKIVDKWVEHHADMRYSRILLIQLINRIFQYITQRC